MKWYYAIGEKPIGPVKRAELDSLYEAGQITTATMILQEGMYDWVPYVDMKKTTQFLPSFGKKENPPETADEAGAQSEPVAAKSSEG